MISLKTQKEIVIMREGGRRLRRVLVRVLRAARPGERKIDLERLAEEEIEKQGGKSSFKMVKGYRWTTCLTINDEVVHGIPDEQVLENGDILGVDIGLFYQGFHTDLATTVAVGRISQEKQRFLAVGRKALSRAIDGVKVGHFLGDLSLTIEREIRKAGYRPVKVLTGHGIGRRLHEAPNIPCFLQGELTKTPRLKLGMTLAIEVIYNLGSEKIVMEQDGWTIRTRDGKISGLFEETVAVTASGPLILTDDSPRHD